MSSFKNRLIIGRQPLVEAIESGKTIDKILLQKNASGDSLSYIFTHPAAHTIILRFSKVRVIQEMDRPLIKWLGFD